MGYCFFFMMFLNLRSGKKSKKKENFFIEKTIFATRNYKISKDCLV